jgi:signal transduction histidine kinase
VIPESEEKLIKVLPEPTLLLLGDGRIQAVNPPLLHILGVTSEALRERNLQEFVTTPPERVRDYLRTCARSRQMVLGTLALAVAGGAVEEYRCEGAVVRPWSAAAPPLLLLRFASRESASRRFHLLNQKIDELTQEIRRRQQAEADLRQLNATLESRVAERTAELARINSELEQFTYIASHDLKAPLRAIGNLASWISEDAGAVLPPASQEHLAKLRGRIKRLDQFLDDLLAYARAGRGEYPPERVDTAALVRDIIETLAPPATFTFTIHEPMPILLTARVPLENILRNLIANAVKHHDRPNGQIQVAARACGEQIEFAVIDDGPGIAPEFHGRIFEIFQTLHPRDQVEGTGVGLAIVKKSVESYGGSISIESSLGRGAIFRFTWPQ